MYSVYIKKTIKYVDNNLWTLNLWSNLYACIFFIPFTLYENEKITNFSQINNRYFWFILILSGLVSFLVGYLTSLQIKLTSPLTHNISGQTKSYIQTLLGVLIYNEIKTLLWWISNFMVLFGAAMYSYVRNNEMIDKMNRKIENQIDSNAKHSISTRENSQT